MYTLWLITLFEELTIRPAGEEAKGIVRRFRFQKVAALLAYLAYHRGKLFSREHLCELLWPDEDLEITRNRLRVTLGSLRRQLEPPGVSFGTVLETVGNGAVRIRAETVTTDVSLFEAAVRQGDLAGAAEWYGRGVLLPTLYEDWVVGERQRLSALWESLPQGGISSGAPLVSERVAVVAEGGSGTGTGTVALAATLPVYLTRFIGGEAAQARLRGWVEDPSVRLITLTGSGGSGKTRLVVETLRTDTALRAFVPLADLWDAERLWDVLRQALSLPAAPRVKPLDQIIEALRGEPPCRIVLDNVEQIALGTAPIVSELLTRLPHLTIVVTSRRVLDLPGEHELFVAPLALPTDEEPEQVVAADSVRLFRDRAQSVRPDFQVTTRNAAAISALCHLLDGVPLALELAAARAGTMTPDQMLESLRENIASLSADTRRDDKERRHRSLNAVMEWSFALLAPDLRRFFLALSVFRSGWETEAAREVTGEASALDALSRLRGHSLVTMVGGRFALLETLRFWAADRLELSEQNRLQAAHAGYFATFGEKAAAHTGTPDEKPWLDRLEAESANLWSALEFALGQEDAILALRLALITDVLGRARGSLQQARTTMESVLRLPPPADQDHLNARARFSCGFLHQSLGNLSTAREHLQAALPYAQREGKTPLLARILRTLADNAHLEQHPAEEAAQLYDEALALQRTLGDERGAAQTMNSLAMLRREQGDIAAAVSLMQENGDYFRRVGDLRMLSYNLSNLALLQQELGQFEEAEHLYQESLAIARDQSDHWHCLEVLTTLAEGAGRHGQSSLQRTYLVEALPLALRLGHPGLQGQLLQYLADITHADPTRAVTLYAASEALQQTTPESAPKANLNHLRNTLGSRRFRTAWQKGTQLTASEAVALALATA